jgi:sulfatase maturation enzyme AslB (radical SAM superfamily)
MIDQALHWLKKSFANHSSLVFDLKDFDPPPSTQLLILQPTPFCNLDCDYCYLPNLLAPGEN